MANLIKKVVVLGLFLAVVFAVYLVKNKDTREDVLLKLGLAASKDFKIPEDIKIDMADINMDKLALDEKIEPHQPQSEPETPVVTPVAAPEEGIGSTSVEAWKDEQPVKKLTLGEIEDQVKEIGRQVETIEKETDILLAMGEIQKEINDLAQKASEFNLECSICSSLTSI